MTYDAMAGGGLDYFPCKYGESRLMFRGPRRKLSGAYAVAIGGTETYGKFVPRPFPDLLEDHIGLPVANFGAVNAGVDVFMADQSLLRLASAARVAVVQVMGAHNLSNRFYMVHPRRNDRFLKASPLLRMLYPDVDFTEFNFTRHLLQNLYETDPERFGAVRDELSMAWSARMASLLRAITTPAVLLWIADRGPDDQSDIHKCTDRLFVDGAMLETLSEFYAGLVVAKPSGAVEAAGRDGMVFAEVEANAAAEVPNAAFHTEIAEAVAKGVRRLV